MTMRPRAPDIDAYSMWSLAVLGPDEKDVNEYFLS